MPQINPKTGRQLSGAQKRAAAKKRTTTYKAAVAAVAATPAAPQVPGSADFAQLAPPPLGDPATAIAWVNDALLIALSQVLKDPALDNLSRWKWIKDFGATLGLVRDKSSEQAAIKRALGAQQAAQQAQGTVSASGRVKGAVSRPPG